MPGCVAPWYFYMGRTAGFAGAGLRAGDWDFGGRLWGLRHREWEIMEIPLPGLGV